MTEDARPCGAQEDAGDSLNISVDRYASALRTRTALTPGGPLELAEWLVESCSSKRNGHKDAGSFDAQDANSGDDDGEGDVRGKRSRAASPDLLGGGGGDDDDDGEDLDEENADEADAADGPPRARTQTESTVEEDLAAVAQALELAKAAVEQLQLKMVLKANEQMDVMAQREIQTRDGGKRYSSGEIERTLLRAGVPVVGARTVTSATSCAKCSRYFSAFQRGRNCSTCGHLYCAKCVSRHQVVPSKFGHGDAAVRVCDPCSDWLQRAMDRYFDAVDIVQRGRSEQDERKRRDHELLALRVRARSRSDRAQRHSMAATDSRSKQWFSGNLRAMHVSDRPLRRRSTNAIDVKGILPYNDNGDEDDLDRDNSENADGPAESQPAPISTFTRPPSISIDTSRPGNRRRLESSDGEDANEEEGDDESATPLEDLSQLDLEIKSPDSPAIPEDLINITVSRTRSVSKPVELESKKNAPRKTKYSRSASIDFASLSTICAQPSLPMSPAASDASESAASIDRGSVASSGDLRASFSSSKKYFDDSDIVDDRRSFVGSSDAGGGVDSDATSDSQRATEPRGAEFLPATVLRFAVYDVGSKESHSLKRSIVRFGRKNVLVDRYTVEVDRAQGVVRVKSVFMHRYWAFRCDAVYSVMAVASSGSGVGGSGGGGGAVARVVVVTHDGHGGHLSLDWEFGSEADRDQFKAVVDELKSRKVSPISTRSSHAGRRDGEATTDAANATLTGPTSISSDEAVPSGSPRVRSLFQLLPGEVTITPADIPVTLLIGPAADSSTSVGEIAVWGRMRGFVFVTNYRVMFVHTTEQCKSHHRSLAVAYIPLFAVTSSQVVFAGGRRPRSTRAFQSTAPPVVVVSCKDAREMRLEIEGSLQVVDDLAQNLLATINRLADAAQRYRQVQSAIQSPAPSSPSTMTLEGLEIGDRVHGVLSEQYVRDPLPSSGNDLGGMNGSPRSQATSDSLLSPALIPISGGVSTTSPIAHSSDRSDAFAFFYSIGSIPDDVNGWKLYTDEREFRRQIVADPIAQPFLKFYQNTRGNVCKSYPAKLLVPSSMTSSTLMKVAEFRAKNRLPVVTYYHQRNRCVLVRSGQPLLGNLLSGSSSLSDQLLLGVYRRFPEIIRTQSHSAPSSRPIYVFDARKLKASTGNRLMGKGGVETPQDYPGAVIHHLNIANMYRMQSSYQALLKLVVPGGVDDQDKAWLSSLEATRWLSHVRQVLEGAVKIARVLELEGSSVLVHCSDGWDRTAQLTALAQIMIDPYFRTIRGFAVVVEKDWCAFGHKFAERLGGDRAKDPQRSKSSPVMFQFLDAVWQMLRQFPTAFEFDERFLLHIANSLTSGLYGTFLYDSRFDRDANDVKNTTVSVWTPVLMTPEAFRNSEYSPMDSPLWPWTSTQMVRLWEAYFFQWHSKYFGCRWTASLVHHHHHDYQTTHHGQNGTKGELRTAMANNRSVSLDETRSSGSPAATGSLTPASTTSSSVARDRQSSGEFGTIMGGAARSLRQQHADKKSPPMHKIFLFKS